MKILIAGDFCPQKRVSALFEKGDFAFVLGGVKPFIEQADYSIVNFECPITKGHEQPIKKCGPNLNCSSKGIEAIKWAGVSGVTLANNHFFDYGEEGVFNTLQACSEFEIDVVGGGKNIQGASQILYKDIAGSRFAIINCCEHEFSIATETTAGANPLNPIQQYYAIRQAQSNADYVLVIVHGGHEHYQLPSPRMQDTYRFFIDAGADAVVNHHQHCFSGYEIYNGKPIFYGLGNFCFDKGYHINDLWNYGFFIILSFSSSGISFDIIPYKQCSDAPTVQLIPISEISEQITSLNSIIAEKKKLDEETSNYYQNCFGEVTSLIEPPIGRFFKDAQWKGWIPSLVGKKWARQLFDYVNCESHRDKVLFFLNKKMSS